MSSNFAISSSLRQGRLPPSQFRVPNVNESGPRSLGQSVRESRRQRLGQHLRRDDKISSNSAPSAAKRSLPHEPHDPSRLSGDPRAQAYAFFIAELVEQSGGDREEFLARVQMNQSAAAKVPAEYSHAISAVSTASSFSSTFSSAFTSVRVFQPGGGAFSATAVDLHFQGRVDFFREIQLENGELFRIEGFVEVEIRIQTLTVEAVFAPRSDVPQQGDPLALDIDGDGVISLSSWENGVLFDLNADGILDRTAFVQGSDIFLGLDRNQNGKIDDGGELFGDQHGAANGFLELGRYDENFDGVIDAQDSVFALLLGVRRVGDSIVSEPLDHFGVESIHLHYTDVNERAQGENRILQRGHYQSKDGRSGLAVDVLLNFQRLV